jgi:ElaB/YqjD/DUF883 family membrane-anchored ribosome-binding protein
MGDNRSDLPEGTDTIVEGASNPDETPALPQGSGAEAQGDSVTVDTSLATQTEIPAPRGDAERPVVGSGSAETGLAGKNDRTGGESGNLIERLRSGSENLTSQAGERARGLVSQGLERSSDALSNVSRLVGDTAAGLDERLGPEFGEYARKAASAIESTANTIASKDPDELIEDTRNFVRNSPGVAIAGAAIVGFALARLLKSGISSRDEDDDA